MENPKHRARALRTLASTERMRGRREVFAELLASLGTGTKRRTIYDAQQLTTLPGKLAREKPIPRPATWQSMRPLTTPARRTTST